MRSLYNSRFQNKVFHYPQFMEQWSHIMRKCPRLWEACSLSFGSPSERHVQCPACTFRATMKPTKTNHLMLRCDNCRLILFGNGPISQKWIGDLQPIN